MLHAFRPRSFSASSSRKNAPTADHPAPSRDTPVLSSTINTKNEAHRLSTAPTPVGKFHESREHERRHTGSGPPLSGNATEFASLLEQPVTPRRPPRHPDRPSPSKRPSTASGLPDSKSAWSPPSSSVHAARFTHTTKPSPVKPQKKTPANTRRDMTAAYQNTDPKAHFSTADRTILEELKLNIRARDSQFVIKGGKKYHPYPAKEVPYPRSYDRIVVDHDVWEVGFCQQLCKSVTWHTFKEHPAKTLDIGCGAGTWIMNCARIWKESRFVGLDIVPLQPDLQSLGFHDLASRIKWIQANFLEGLPFPNEEFDFVHITRIARAVPEDKWDLLLEEILRVMKPGAAIEVIEEDLYFPGSSSDPLVFHSGEANGGHAPSSPTTSPTQTSPVSKRHSSPYAMRKSTPALMRFAGPSSESAIDLSKPPASPGYAKTSYDDDDNGTIRASSQIHLPQATRPVPASAPSSSPTRPGSRSQTSLPSPVPRKQSLSAMGPRKPPPTVEQIESLARTYPIPFTGMLGMGFAIGTISDPMPISPPASIISFSDAHSSSHMLGEETVKSAPAAPVSKAMYHPAPKQLSDPRDHSLLETIFKEMHAARFINMSPLALLTNLLTLYFKDVRSHAPISFAFPPRPAGETKRRRNVARADAWSDLEEDDDDHNHSHDEDEEMAHSRRHQHPHYPSISPPHSHTGDRSVIHREEVFLRKQPYIIIDNARAPARSRASTFSRSSPATDARSSQTLQAPHASDATDRALPLLQHPAVAYTRPSAAGMARSTNSLPNKTLDFDLKALNLHLSARVQETLACAEAMWEWVRDYQKNYRPRASSSSSFSLTDVDVEADARMREIRSMTRADFDACLLRFELDMRDRTALGPALEEHLAWSVVHFARSQESRNFDAACDRWDTCNAAGAMSTLEDLLESGEEEEDEENADDDDFLGSPGRSARQGGGDVLGASHTLRLSRTFRVFAAWKA